MCSRGPGLGRCPSFCLNLAQGLGSWPGLHRVSALPRPRLRSHCRYYHHSCSRPRSAPFYSRSLMRAFNFSFTSPVTPTFNNTPPARQKFAPGNHGFDHKTAAGRRSGLTLSALWTRVEGARCEPSSLGPSSVVILQSLFPIAEGSGCRMQRPGC